MVMVVLLHITGHGIKNADIELFSGPFWMTSFLNTFSLVAVNCFVLISGYYLSTSTINHKKIINLWIQVFSYSVGIYIFMCLLPDTGVTFNMKDFVKQCMPLLSNQYWFFKCYFLLYILTPIINKFIDSLGKEEYEKVLMILLVIFSVVPSINIFGDTFGANYGYSLIWFIILYLIAAYLRRWPLRNKKYGIYYVVVIFFVFAVRIIGEVVGTQISIAKVLSGLQLHYNSPFVMMASICLFLYAVNCKKSFGETGKRVIGSLASLSFGVYLLHDHGIVRDILWNQWVCLV